MAILAAAGLLKLNSMSAPSKSTLIPFQTSGLPLSVFIDQETLDPVHLIPYKSMPDILDGYTLTPKDRLAYDAAVDTKDFRPIQWSGCIRDVRRKSRGHLVTIGIIPLMSSDHIGACTVVLDSDYSEQYQVFIDGSFRSVGFLDRQGLAGRMPEMAGL